MSKLQLLEQKVVLALLLKYYSEEISVEKRYFLTAAEYAVYINSIKHGNYRRFEFVCESIIDKFTITPEGEHQTLVKRARYLKERQQLDKGEVGLVIEFNPIFASYCNYLKGLFFKEAIHQCLKFKSIYSFRVLLMFFIKSDLTSEKIKNMPSGTNIPLEIPMNDFRVYTDTIDSYSRLPDMKARVINKALSIFSDLKIVDKLGFTISLEKGLTLDLVPLNMSIL